MTAFPDGFLWGAATSAYQIEGSPLADGGGPSIQHRFAHTPGNTLDGATGDVAADHYHRFREDVALMRELGLGGYQFSVPWSRVVPDGHGAVNHKGLDFYDALVDALLEAGIAPVPVLHVWELPGAAQDRGGWANRDCAEWFGDFASAVYRRIGDRATHWFTICEPASVAHFGYVLGELAPCIRDIYAGLRAAHHLLLGQGRAVQAFRASGATGQIGNYHALTDILPATGSDADLAAADRTNAYVNTLYLDAIVRGEYPESMVDWFGDAWPEVADGDMATISAPLDFLGFSYYSHSVVADAVAGCDDGSGGGERRVEDIGAAGPLDAGVERLLRVRALPPTRPTTDLGWEIVPDGLARQLTWVHERYGGPPIFIGELGASFADTVTEDGRVHDRARIDYLADHVKAAHRAIEAGVDLRGMFVWSLLDTYEFNLGYGTRFGLIRVDYETQQRTIKDSGYWFRDVVAANGLPS
ncbi:glycoside hydrolase family 1 protein [Pseudonocardia acaciae]|uniref:glycoside hydrolase family 1 protein n=1 Tax=Pseudonocardia acaciae TaxID=551276 RepID=UPI00048CE89B|nr:family 1 glycosylhydrolase [Pseudonocardia acaciae]